MIFVKIFLFGLINEHSRFYWRCALLALTHSLTIFQRKVNSLLTKYKSSRNSDFFSFTSSFFPTFSSIIHFDLPLNINIIWWDTSISKSLDLPSIFRVNIKTSLKRWKFIETNWQKLHYIDSYRISLFSRSSTWTKIEFLFIFTNVTFGF